MDRWRACPTSFAVVQFAGKEPHPDHHLDNGIDGWHQHARGPGWATAFLGRKLRPAVHPQVERNDRLLRFRGSWPWILRPMTFSRGEILIQRLQVLENVNAGKRLDDGEDFLDLRLHVDERRVAAAHRHLFSRH